MSTIVPHFSKHVNMNLKGTYSLTFCKSLLLYPLCMVDAQLWFKVQGKSTRTQVCSWKRKRIHTTLKRPYEALWET